jgi:hypothetical protein
LGVGWGVEDLELAEETAGLVALLSPPAMEPLVGLLVLDAVDMEVERLLLAEKKKINLLSSKII